MSQTTEESDWRDGPSGAGSNSPLLTGPEPPVLPTDINANSSEVERAASPPAIQAKTSALAASIDDASEDAQKSLLETTIAPSENNGPSVPAINPMLPPDVSQRLNQNTPEWEMARDSVLSQMVTSQDIDGTTTPKMTRGGIIKRGGRASRGGPGSRGGRGGRPKIKIEPPPEDADPNAPPRKVNRGGRPRGSRAGGATSTRGVNKGGRPRGSRAGASTGRGASKLKRKRTNGEDDEDDAGNSDSSEEITALPTQSRSGRRITQVVSPVVIDLAFSLKPSNKRLSNISASSDPASAIKRPAKKRVTLSAVCHNCGRGHSPQTNQIVFCDGCNTPWHQYCHDSPITPSVIQEEDKDWFCADCETQKEEAGYLARRIPALETMGLAEKRRLLEGMERAELVALLLRASTLHPDLPLLKPPQPDPAVIVTAAAATTTPAGAVAKGEAEFEYYEPEPLPYPRVGNGVQLPPEEDDVEGGILIDEDVVTYSHSWIESGAWTGAMGEAGGGFGLPGPAGGVAIGVGA